MTQSRVVSAAFVTTWRILGMSTNFGVCILHMNACIIIVSTLHAGWGRCGIEVEDADGELYLATAPELERVTGEYFVSKRKRRMPAVVYDAATRAKLWRILEEQTGVKFPA